MSRAIFLTNTEMKILLYKKKINGIVIFDELTKDILSELDAKKAVESLITNGYLIPDGEGFKFSDEIELIMEIMRNASCTYRVRIRQDREPVKCVYEACEKSIAMQMDPRTKDMVRVEIFDEDSAFESVLEGGFGAPASDNSLEEGDEETLDMFNIQAQFLSPKARILVERYERGMSKYDRQLLVEESDTQDFAYIDDGIVVKKYPYMKDVISIFRGNNA